MAGFPPRRAMQCQFYLPLISWMLGYPAEFDFRYSNRIKLGVDDTERTRRAIKGAGGKRLTYRRTRNQAKEAGAA